MADPLWFGPPESVAALLETSDPSTVVANIAAWLSEVISHELNMGMSMANIAATIEQWIGLGGAASAIKGTELNFGGLMPMVAHCLKQMAIGQAAVEANTVARSAVIPAAVCQSNRDETAVLYGTNICGCNSPAIAVNEDMYYNFFWPQNMSAGLMYAGVLNTLMAAITSTPPPFTPLGASPAAAATPVETVADSAANSATGLASGPAEAAQTAGATAASPAEALNQFLQPATQAVSAVTGQAQNLISAPVQGVQGMSSSATGLLQNFVSGGMFPASSQAGAVAAETASVETVAGSLGSGGGAAGGLGVSAGGGAGGYTGAGLTSFTRPASTFEPEIGGRPTGLKPGGLLNAAELRGPTTAGMGGAPMPMSPAAAGMLGRDGGAGDKETVTHARIVVDQDKQDIT